jgi:hypothetical protein
MLHPHNPSSHPGADTEITSGNLEEIQKKVALSKAPGSPFATTLISGKLLIDATDKSAYPYKQLGKELAEKRRNSEAEDEPTVGGTEEETPEEPPTPTQKKK